jgi:hypothetical protein
MPCYRPALLSRCAQARARPSRSSQSTSPSQSRSTPTERATAAATSSPPPSILHRAPPFGYPPVLTASSWPPHVQGTSHGSSDAHPASSTPIRVSTSSDSQLLAVHGQLLAVHGQLLAVHGQLLAVHGQLLAVHGQLLAVQRKVATRHLPPVAGIAMRTVARAPLQDSLLLCSIACQVARQAIAHACWLRACRGASTSCPPAPSMTKAAARSRQPPLIRCPSTRARSGASPAVIRSLLRPSPEPDAPATSKPLWRPSTS